LNVCGDGTRKVPRAAMTEIPMLLMDAVLLAQSKLDTFAQDELMDAPLHVP
jgi:hypothetical protein